METLEGYNTRFEKLKPKIQITGSRYYTTTQTSSDKGIKNAITFFKKAARQLPVQQSTKSVKEITPTAESTVINGNKTQNIQPTATNDFDGKEFNRNDNPNDKPEIETVKSSLESDQNPILSPSNLPTPVPQKNNPIPEQRISDRINQPLPNTPINDKLDNVQTIIKPITETISEPPPKIINEEIDTTHSTGIDSANIASHDDREISLAPRSESDESNNSQQDNNTKVLEEDVNRESLSEEFNDHPKNLTNNGLSTDLDSTLNSHTDVKKLSPYYKTESPINPSAHIIKPDTDSYILKESLSITNAETDPQSSTNQKNDNNAEHFASGVQELTRDITEEESEKILKPERKYVLNHLKDNSNKPQTIRHHNHLDTYSANKTGQEMIGVQGFAGDISEKQRIESRKSNQSNPLQEKHKIPEQITSVGSVHIEKHKQSEEFRKTLSTKGPPNQLFTKIDSGDKVTYVTSENIIYIYDKLLKTTNEYQKSINNLEKMRKVRIENGVLQIMFDGKFESVTEPDLDKYYEHVKKPAERTKTFFRDMMEASLAVLNDIGGVIH